MKIEDYQPETRYNPYTPMRRQRDKYKRVAMYTVCLLIVVMCIYIAL